MLGKMLQVKRPRNEMNEFYYARYNTTINRLMEKHSIMSWDTTVLKMGYNFPGHVERMKSYDEGRIAHQALKYRNRDWLLRVGGDSGGSQKHCRRFHMWRWEHQFYSHFESRGI